MILQSCRMGYYVTPSLAGGRGLKHSPGPTLGPRSRYSLLSWRERIETESENIVWRRTEGYSLLSWRERIETTYFKSSFKLLRVTPSLAGGRGLKRFQPRE